jgi:hypothetical protein
MECEEELCSECAEYHTNLKMARNHHVVDLKLKTSFSALLKKPSLVCKQHKYCQVEYFVLTTMNYAVGIVQLKHTNHVSIPCLWIQRQRVPSTQLFSDCQEQLTSFSQTYKSILKYREENVSSIKDDKQRIKENMKKLKEKLIQKIN